MTVGMSFNQLSEEEKMTHFLDRINAGEKIEPDDWMPNDYRLQLIRLISMHGISEIMGALPERSGYLKHLHFIESLQSWRRFRMRWAMDSFCFV